MMVAETNEGLVGNEETRPFHPTAATLPQKSYGCVSVIAITVSLQRVGRRSW